MPFFFIPSNDSNSSIQLQLNMEVSLKPEQISNLKEFVNHLSLTTHSSVPGSLVIWWALEDTILMIFLLKWKVPAIDFYVFSWSCRYDSVTINGDLWWQNELNEHNKPFFDICDGIFTNYSWQVLLMFPCHAAPILVNCYFPLS